MLTSPFNHTVSYLRLSVTDRCNERCLYCMPEETQEWLPRSGILSYEEILRVARVAAGMGVSKFRITGGEPLTRKDILHFMAELARIPGVANIGMTTNGTLLKDNALALRKAGLHNLNISLDSLDATTYAQIAGRDLLGAVQEGIDAAIAAGFDNLKLNMVVIRGRNDHEILDMIAFARRKKLILKLIEVMPVSTRDVLTDENFISVGEMIKSITAQFALVPLGENLGNGPAIYYTDESRSVKIGFIGAMTNLHFCESCNKMRLTAEGKLRPCLGNHDEYDLRELLRTPGVTDELIARTFADVVARKPKEHTFRENYQPGRRMIAIGG